MGANIKNKTIKNVVRKVLVRQARQGHTRDPPANPGGAPPPTPPTFRFDFRPVGWIYARLPPVGGTRSGL